MLGAGSAPRVELRVVRWSGLEYRIALEMTGSAALEGRPPVPGPTVFLSLRHEVIAGSAAPMVERRDGGIVRLIEERGVLESASVRHPTAPAALVDGWNRGLRPLVGTSFRQRVSEDNAIPWMKSELFGGAEPPPEVRQALDRGLETQRHFPFRLPPVPVGVGATWRFHERLRVNDVDVSQTVNLSLRALDDRVATVGIRLLQEAPRQEVPNPLVPGQKAMLDAYRGDGDGEITVDRMTAIPLAGTLTTMARVTLSGEVNGVHGVATLVWTAVVRSEGSILADDAAGVAPP